MGSSVPRLSLSRLALVCSILVSVTINQPRDAAAQTNLTAQTLGQFQQALNNTLDSLGSASVDLIDRDPGAASANLATTVGLAEDLLGITQTSNMTNALGKATGSIQKAVAQFVGAVVRAQGVVNNSAAGSNAWMSAVSSAGASGRKVVKALLKVPAAGSLVILEELSSSANGIYAPGQRALYRIHAPARQTVQVSVSNNVDAVVMPAVQWTSPTIFYVTTGPSAGGAQITATVASQTQASVMPLANNGHFKKGNAPNPPNGLAAVAMSSSEIDLNWTNTSPNITGFTVVQATVTNGPWTQIALVGAGDTSYANTGLVASTTYFYQVQAYNSSGSSAYSDIADAATPASSGSTTPSVPAGLAAVAASSSEIDLTWNSSNDNGGPGLAGYAIYQAGVQVGTTTSTGYAVTGLSASTQYCYTIAAYDTAGGESGQSAQACAITQTAPDTTPPSVPGNPVASAVSSSQINLAWNASTDTGGSGMAGYKVYQGAALIGTTSSTNYSSTGLTPATQYCFTIAAYDGAGNVSGWSLQACATTQTLPDTTPPTVSMTAPSNGSRVKGTISLSASASDNVGVTQVTFYRDSGVLLATDTGSPYTANFDSTTVADGSHTFYALAYDAAGNVGTSAAVTVTVDNTAPTVTLTSPVNGSVVSNTIALSATASDNSGVWKVEFYRDGSTLLGTSTGAPYSMAFDTTALSAGAHSFYAKAYDMVTNMASSATSSVTVNNTASTNTTPALVGYLPDVGTARDVMTTGNIAYVASDVWGLALADISNPAAPKAIGASDVPFDGAYVAVSGTLACVTGYRSYFTPANTLTNVDGFYVVDVSVSSNATLVGLIEGQATFNGVAIAGHDAYVASGSAGVNVIDIGNPASPSIVATYTTPAYAFGVTVSGNYAYVADGVQGLQILNISNPASPSFVGSVDTPGTAKDVAVSGGYAYVADGNSVQIISVSNPASPVIVGVLPVSYPNSIVKVKVQGSTIYAAGSAGGLLVIDVSNPSSPVLLGTLPPAGVTSASTIGVCVAGTTAYIANYVAGLGVVDVSTLSSPSQTGNLMEWFAGAKVASSGGTTVVAGLREWDGGLQTISALRIINTQTPSAPVLVGSLETNALTFSAAAIGGTHVYAACGTAGLRVIDISNPSAPVIVGSYKPSGYVWGITLVGQYVYLATGSQGLSIVDVSNPASPANMGSIVLPGTAKDVTVTNGAAYVADGNSLQIVNVNNPASPSVLGSLSMGYPISAVAVKVQNNVAYVAGSAGGLITVDVSNPASPQQLGSLAAAGNSSASTIGLFISGTKAYLGNSVGGLAIADVSNPSSPVLRNLILTMGNAGDVIVSSGWAYAADSLATLDTIYLGP